jgi:hypothetical protein
MASEYVQWSDFVKTVMNLQFFKSSYIFDQLNSLNYLKGDPCIMELGRYSDILRRCINC